jgi:Protein of unknown function (DUF4013)
MNITGIVKDSLKYPLSDWKKILIIGILSIIGGSVSLLNFIGITNNAILSIFVVVGLISGLLIDGYLFKIVKTSLDGGNKLPEFNDWKNLLLNGLKVFITFIFYLILPPFVILFLLFLLTGGLSFFGLDVLMGGSDMSPLNFLTTMILPIIENLFIIAVSLLNQYAIILLAEFIVILPFFLVAVSNMAYEGEFRDAFRFGELIEILRDIGWLNFIKWYIATGVIFLLLFGLGTLISLIISISYGSILFYLIPLLLSLILLPYVQMYYVRAVALVYKPE